jgi:hypothetical protein
VDAAPPVVPTRTVPILTTFDKESHLGSDHASPAPGVGSRRSIAGEGARVISVLTPTGTTSPGDMQVHNSGEPSGSRSGDRYHT